MDNRQELISKNYLWTISENYDINVNPIFLDKLPPYLKMTTSYAFNDKDNDLLVPYLDYLKEIDRHETFYNLFIEGLSFFSYEKLSTSRPVLESYRHEYYKANFSKFNNKKKNDIVDEIKYTLSARYFNEVPKTTDSVKDLADKIKKFESFNNLENLIEYFETLIGSQFHFNESLITKENKERKKFDKDGIKEKQSKSENLLEDEYGLIGSAEFTSDLDLDGLERDEKTKLSLDDIQDDEKEDKYILAENVFGKSLLTSKTKLVLEKEICTGLHSNSKLIISKGDYSDNLEALYRKRRLEEVTLENKDYFDFFKNKFTRDQYNIERNLKLSLIRNTESRNKHAKNGNINPSNIYRATILNDPRIFIKDQSYPDTNISIDILIDNSASQLDRKEKIASWVYVVTNALVSIGIPTRVMGFSNLENYLGLKIYRDYKDALDKNENIFSFIGQGSNRDGLAFKLVKKLIETNPYNQKILIHFTDGKPYDVRTRVDNNSKLQEKRYTDKLAEDDTAKEFRKLEQSGILPLVIFTGTEDDISSMKKIYGNNFAYIKDLDRFSSVLVQYVKRILEDN